MPDRPLTAEALYDLTEALEKLGVSLDEHSIKIRDAEIAVDRVSDEAAAIRRYGRWSIVAGAVCFCLALLVSAYALKVGSDTQDALKAVEEARFEARVSSCIQANKSTEGARLSQSATVLVFTEHFNTLIEDGITEQELIDFARDPHPFLTEREKVLYDARVLVVNATLPYRDCSPEGLDEFFRDPPADPATTSVTGTLASLPSSTTG